MEKPPRIINLDEERNKRRLRKLEEDWSQGFEFVSGDEESYEGVKSGGESC